MVVGVKEAGETAIANGNCRALKTYLKSKCDVWETCGYRNVSELGCRKNKDVTSPDKCHHYNCMVNIGLIRDEETIIYP